MTNIVELQKAYEAIFLGEMRHEITRDERITQIIALREVAAAGLSFKQRMAIANEAVERAAEITDEVYFSTSGRWQ